MKTEEMLVNTMSYEEEKKNKQRNLKSQIKGSNLMTFTGINIALD